MEQAKRQHNHFRPIKFRHLNNRRNCHFFIYDQAIYYSNKKIRHRRFEYLFTFIFVTSQVQSNINEDISIQLTSPESIYKYYIFKMLAADQMVLLAGEGMWLWLLDFGCLHFNDTSSALQQHFDGTYMALQQLLFASVERFSVSRMRDFYRAVHFQEKPKNKLYDCMIISKVTAVYRSGVIANKFILPCGDVASGRVCYQCSYPVYFINIRCSVRIPASRRTFSN